MKNCCYVVIIEGDLRLDVRRLVHSAAQRRLLRGGRQLHAVQEQATRRLIPHLLNRRTGLNSPAQLKSGYFLFFSSEIKVKS